MTSNKQITPVKILKGVLVFALGVGVYLTERSYRLKVNYFLRDLRSKIIRIRPRNFRITSFWVAMKLPQKCLW